MPPQDFTNDYNTTLTPWEEDQFNQFLLKSSKQRGYDMSKDLYDYDLRGWWKNNADSGLPLGHFTDTYKKPNHPTFSNESQYHNGKEFIGGTWQELGPNRYSFTPGQTNLIHYPPEELQKYFNRAERGNILVFPKSE